MSTDDAGPRSRVVRLVGGAVAVLAGLAILAFLLVAGTVVWIFGVALPRHQHTINDQSVAYARGLADRSQERLTSAATDGSLTDTEISEAVGRMWTIERSAGRWAVTTRFPTAGNDLCFRFDVALPLGPDTRVTHAELPTCQVTGPHPDAS